MSSALPTYTTLSPIHPDQLYTAICSLSHTNRSFRQPSVWLAEGQSSQRDMLLSLQQLKTRLPEPICTIASHRQPRGEILGCADMAFLEPNDRAMLSSVPIDDLALEHLAQSRSAAVVQMAIEQQVKVLLTGRNSHRYEPFRQLCEQAGIRLLTGACDAATLNMLDDKAEFMNHCQRHNIPVAAGYRFDNLEQLQTLLTNLGDIPLCVKPTKGIFAQGFWHLDTGVSAWDSFEHLYHTEHKRIHVAEFIHAYKHSQRVTDGNLPMLLMPYLSGREYSIDVVCERGEVLAAVTRYKEGSIQYVGYDEAVMAVVIPLIKSCHADGIVSVQTKADSEGRHHVLEINSRPSGGIGYTVHSGMDLTQLAFGYWLGYQPKPELSLIAEQIVPCAVRPLMTSIKLSD